MAGYNAGPGFTGNDQIYFANDTSTNCASNLVAKGRSFYNLMEANYYIEKIHRMWQAYHGVYGDNYVGSSHRVEFTGEQGELVQLPVNHFRNIAQHILILVTSNRPTMEARAVNTDYKSLAQTYLANGILEYYMREKHLEDAIQKACELAIVLGSGFIKLEWNATAGDAYDIDPETGEFNYEGEIEFTTLSPLDVVFDGTKENYDNDWIMTRSFQNRFDLIAKYPEYADKIRSVPAKNQSSVYRLAVFSNDDTDDIGVYEFYHKRTESVQEGRYMLFIDSDIVLLDTKLPYRTIPVFRIAPSDILGTPYGYSPMFDIFPIQEAINSLYSTIMTNQSAFGVQNIWVPRGADIALGQLSGGLNVIESDEMPQPINLTQTPAEVFKFLDELIQSAETISGISSVTRGNPEASLKSGTALALVQSMSLQFSSNIQKSYVKLIEDVGTALLNILKDFATTPKIVALVGKYNRPYLKEFTGEDINAISRVIVDPGNPLAQSIAGRVQIAEQLLQMQAIKTPQEYFQVLTTGRLDMLYEGDMAELLLIKSENERMMDGEDVQATVVDQHSIHIKEHKTVIANADIRKDPTLTGKVLAHIQQHIDMLRNTDPDLLELIGEKPLNPPPQPGQLPPPPGQQALPPGQGIKSATQSANKSVSKTLAPNAQGLAVPGQQISGPGIQNVGVPQPPKVPASLLANPALQPSSQLNPKK